jgi:phospholipid-binding lipoprotein MlaA
MIPRLPPWIAVLVVLALAGCGRWDGTSAPGGPVTGAVPGAGPVAASARPAFTGPTDPADPYEGLNRQVLDVNLALDEAALKPIALFYRDITNPWLRARIHNAMQNLNEPAIMVNNLLQGRPLDAGASLLRFTLNSTFGLGGMWDVAVTNDLPRQTRDFGQTLYVWGVGDGPYLMLPFAGPSTARDMAGLIVNGFLNPVNWFIPIGPGIGGALISGLDERERNIENLEELQRGSLDFYARLRSVWRQNRDSELGRTNQQGEGLNFLDDPGATPTGAPAASPAAAPPAAEAPPAATSNGAALMSHVPMRVTVRPARRTVTLPRP